MAQAFDANSYKGLTFSSSISWSHTTSGSNRYLVVGVYADAGTPTATYNGVSMTRVASNGTAHLFVLPNPASGTNTIAVSTGGSATMMFAEAASYTGCSQDSLGDATATGSDSAQPYDLSVTSVADNCWHVAFTTNEGAGAETYSNSGSSVARSYGSTYAALSDSNSQKTPAGSVTVSIGSNTSRANKMVGVTVPPYVATQVESATMTSTDSRALNPQAVRSETANPYIGSSRVMDITRTVTENGGAGSPTFTSTPSRQTVKDILAATVTHTASFVRSTVKTLLETVSTLASEVRSVSKSLSETATQTSSMISGAAKSVSDGLTASVELLFGYGKEFVDSVTHTTSFLYDHWVTWLLSVSDTVSSSASLVRDTARGFAETASLLAEKSFGYFVSLSETAIHSTDTLVEALHLRTKEVIDQARVRIISFSKQTTKALSEALSLTDELSERMRTAYIDALDGIVSLAESVSRSLSRAYEDRVKARMTTALDFAREFSEAVSHSDALERLRSAFVDILAGTVESTISLTKQATKNLVEAATVRVYAPTRSLIVRLNGAIVNLLWRNRTKPTTTWDKR